MPHLNYLAITAAALAMFFLGAVWYGVFGQAWLNFLGKRKEDLNPSDPTPYIVALVGAVLNAFALACLLRELKVETVGHGAMYGAAAAVGFVLATTAKHYSFSGYKWGLFAIDAGYDLVGFVVMGAILGLWK